MTDAKKWLIMDDEKEFQKFMSEHRKDNCFACKYFSKNKNMFLCDGNEIPKVCAESRGFCSFYKKQKGEILI